MNIVRWVLRGLPALLIAVSLIELGAAALAWGAASHAGIPDAYPTIAGIAFGLPALVVGVLVLRDVVRKTTEPFSVFHLQLAAGFAALIIAIVLEAALASRIADPSTYNTLVDADGTPNTSPSGFLFIALFTTVFFGGFVVIVSYLYSQSINPQPRTPFDRMEGERDGVGEMLAGKPRDRSGRWDGR
jgi:hypothetical protein